MKQILLLCLFLLLIAGCKERTEVFATLDRAEALMESAPDSALTLLQSLDAETFHKRSTHARHPLLKSMALDKNVIDTTTFDVLQPALDYYLEKGTPDEKLRTYYYQGRIYQNRKETDAAMKAFIKGKDLQYEMTDTLTLAHLLVAQSTLHYTAYQLENFIENQLLAADLYGLTDRPYYQFTSLLKALDGSILTQDQPLADSLYTVCRIHVSQNAAYESLFVPFALTYTFVFGSPDEVRDILEFYSTQDDLTNMARLDMAYGYSRIGEPAKALHLLNSVDAGSSTAGALKYLSIKTEILKANRKYEEALNCFQLYSETLDSLHQALFSQDLLFAEEKHDMEMKSWMEIQNKNRLIGYSICGFFILLLVIGWIYYCYRNSRLEYERQKLEKENLQIRLSQLEDESEKLKSLLAEQEELPAPISEVIKERIELLNGLLAAQIAGNEAYAKPYKLWLDKILMDREKFMNSTRMAFMASHPRFMEYLEEYGLTEYEINYLCLYAIGLRGKDVGEYIQLKRHYHLSSDIRKKLGIDEHETNIGIYVRKLMNSL